MWGLLPTGSNVLSHCPLMCLFSMITMVSFQHSCPSNPNTCRVRHVYSLLETFHWCFILSDSEAKFLCCPSRPPRHLALHPLWLLTTSLSLSQFKPRRLPYCSSSTPNMHLPPGCRFCFPGTLFHHVFSWFHCSYLHKIQIDNLFGGKDVWDALKIFILSEPSSFLLRIPPKGGTHYKCKDL